MFIEMIDSLRCTEDHEGKNWLVASIMRREDRFVIDGWLGCPVCHREYPIEQGIVWFGREPDAPADASTGAESAQSDPEDVMRAGALLAVTERAAVALCGGWARHAHALAELMPLRIFVLNPDRAIQESSAIGVVQSSEGLPFGPASLRGIALDASTVSERDMRTALYALATHGRLVAPANVTVPDGITELARDGEVWVGEKRGPLLSIGRR